MQYTNIKIIYFLKPVANIYRHHYRTEVIGMKDDYFTILFAKLVESGQLDSETAKKWATKNFPGKNIEADDIGDYYGDWATVTVILGNAYNPQELQAITG